MTVEVNGQAQGLDERTRALILVVAYGHADQFAAAIHAHAKRIEATEALEHGARQLERAPV